METCPICLDEIKNTDNFLYMPKCNHKVHTTCELKAAQYDVRCPICRTKDERLTTRQEDDIQLYSNLERVANEREYELKKYKRKRARVIKKNSKLTKMKEKLNEEKKNFIATERRLEILWMKLQKDCWKNDKNIQKLKNERKKHQRKTNSLWKKLDDEVENIVGPKPDDIILDINFNYLNP